MNAVLKERFFRWFHVYDVIDENGNILFRIHRQYFFFGATQIYDVKNHYLGGFIEKYSPLQYCYDFYIGNEYAGQLVRDAKWHKANYMLDFYGWRIQGNILTEYFRLADMTGKLIATAERQWKEISGVTVAFGPAVYEMYIADSENLLCAVLVILAMVIEHEVSRIH